MSDITALWSRSPRAATLPVDAVFEHVGEELFVTDWRVVDRAHLDSFHWSVDSVPEASDTSTNAAFPRGADNIDGVMLIGLVQAAFFNNYPFWSEGWISYNYGFDRLRFPHTVYLDDALRLRCTLAEATRRPSGILMRNSITMDVQGSDRPALSAEFLVLAAPAT